MSEDVVLKVLCESSREKGVEHAFGYVIRDEDGVLWLRLVRAGSAYGYGVRGKRDRVRVNPALGVSRAGCGCRVEVMLHHIVIMDEIRAGRRVMWL